MIGNEYENDNPKNISCILTVIIFYITYTKTKFNIIQRSQNVKYYNLWISNMHLK